MAPSDQEAADARVPDPAQISSPEQFAQVLRSLRASANLSIRDVFRELERRPSGSAPISTLGGWFSGSHLPTPKLAAVFAELLVVCGETDQARIGAWLAALSRIRPVPGPRAGSSVSPYRGLAAYQPEHADIYCGRAELVTELVDVVMRQWAEGSPAIVVGSSGSGKSSLLQAGLIPAMGKTDDRLQWITFAPGGDPIGELSRQLAALTGESSESLADRLLDAPESSWSMLRSTAPRTGDGGWAGLALLILVDQFEELFTLCKDEVERRIFVKALCAVAHGGGDGGDRLAAVVVGMRADFYVEATKIPELLPILQHGQLIVRPMSKEQLRQSITQPARHMNLNVNDGLVEVLLRDVQPASDGRTDTAHDPGALPLLSHALYATWQHAQGRTLTVDQYMAAGGIQGAVAKTADDAFVSLESDEQRILARNLFVRLVLATDDAADTRRRVQRAELFGDRNSAAAADMQKVLDRFVAARIVTAGRDGIEITHEAVLRAWPRLKGWLDTDRSWLRLHRRLTTAVRAWQDAGEEPDGLYRGTTLAVLREWTEERGYRRDLNAAERRFLDKSVSAQAEHARRERLRARRWYQVSALLAVLAVVAASVFVYASQLRNRNVREQAQADSRYVANEADRLRGQDPSLSMQLGLIAYRIWPTPEARSAMLQSTDQIADTRALPTSGKAESVATADNGRLLALGTNNGTVELWMVDSPGRLNQAAAPLPAGSQAVVAAAFTPNGQLLAAGGEDGVLRLWDTADPAHPQALAALTGAVGKIYSVAVNSRGTEVAVGAGNGDVYLWDVRTPARPVPLPSLTGPSKKITSVAFGQDDRIVVAGSDDSTVRIWTTADPAHRAPLSTVSVKNSEIFAVAVSPGGHTLAAGAAAEHSVHLWNIADPVHPAPDGAPLTGPASWINSLSFSPDGRTLAAGSSDGRAWLFDLNEPQVVSELPHPGPVTTVRYANDSSLLTVANDGELRRWRLPGPVIRGARDSIFGASFDASGTELGVAPGAADDTLTLWNTSDVEHPRQLGPAMADRGPGAPRYSGSGALTPDGRTFVAGDDDGTFQVWDVSDRSHPRPLGGPVAAASDLVEAVTLSDDGTLAAISSDDGTIRLFDFLDRSHPTLLSTLVPPSKTGLIYQAAFSHDGRLVVMASTDRNVYLWDVADARKPTLLATRGGFSNAVYAVAFNLDDEVLAAGSADGTVRLWRLTDARNPVLIGTPLTGPVAHVYSIAFERNRDELAVGSTDGTIWLWDLSDPVHPVDLATLTGAQNGVLVVAFSTDGHTLAAGGHDQEVRLWNIDPAAVAQWICSVAGQPLRGAEWTQFVPVPQFDPCR